MSFVTDSPRLVVLCDGCHRVGRAQQPTSTGECTHPRGWKRLRVDHHTEHYCPKCQAKGA